MYYDEDDVTKDAFVLIQTLHRLRLRQGIHGMCLRNGKDDVVNGLYGIVIGCKDAGDIPKSRLCKRMILQGLQKQNVSAAPGESPRTGQARSGHNTPHHIRAFMLIINKTHGRLDASASDAELELNLK